eukprot:TRINITY_DN13146_c0_g1_i1.p1 TRINITY_DN13146_c0_g1~~TRINITY_DN13146_c0_g1_i1.p1  ORF type:complete len:368 (-),score=86.08 TRINITY_DN13146_c0_g1_i1:8-949(-)
MDVHHIYRGSAIAPVTPLRLYPPNAPVSFLNQESGLTSLKCLWSAMGGESENGAGGFLWNLWRAPAPIHPSAPRFLSPHSPLAPHISSLSLLSSLPADDVYSDSDDDEAADPSRSDSSDQKTDKPRPAVSLQQAAHLFDNADLDISGLRLPSLSALMAAANNPASANPGPPPRTANKDSKKDTTKESKSKESKESKESKDKESKESKESKDKESKDKDNKRPVSRAISLAVDDKDELGDRDLDTIPAPDFADISIAGIKPPVLPLTPFEQAEWQLRVRMKQEKEGVLMALPQRFARIDQTISDPNLRIRSMVA